MRSETGRTQVSRSQQKQIPILEARIFARERFGLDN
jgi:hypothetical protein